MWRHLLRFSELDNAETKQRTVEPHSSCDLHTTMPQIQIDPILGLSGCPGRNTRSIIEAAFTKIHVKNTQKHHNTPNIRDEAEDVYSQLRTERAPSACPSWHLDLWICRSSARSSTGALLPLSASDFNFKPPFPAQ